MAPARAVQAHVARVRSGGASLAAARAVRSCRLLSSADACQQAHKLPKHATNPWPLRQPTIPVVVRLLALSPATTCLICDYCSLLPPPPACARLPRVPLVRPASGLEAHSCGAGEGVGCTGTATEASA